MGSAIKKQYAYLDGFAKEIQANPEAWINGRLDARMNLYKESAYTTLADFQAREYGEQGYDEEINILGVADHCDDCLAETGRGWVPIGTLIPIGDRQCIVNCKCTIDYRRSANNMLFAPAQNNDMLFAPGISQ
jgi:hypothetical protein